MKRAPAKKTAKKGLGPQKETSRPVRVASQLKQEVARLISRDLSDPRLEGLVVSNAWISSDLQLAKIFFRIATTDEGKVFDARRADAQKALERAGGLLRKAVTTRLGLRVAPELKFVYDDGLDARTRIEQILEEVKRGT